jgi:hypothetical protein
VERQSPHPEAQFAQLHDAPVKAANGWLRLLRATGRLLLGFAVAILSV